MRNLFIIAGLILSLHSFAECVHEKTVYGSELKNITNSHVYVETDRAIYKPISQISIDEDKLYKIQLTHALTKNKSNDYNIKYLEYYSYGRMLKYLNDNDSLIAKAGYEKRLIGKSIKGRDLYAITPKVYENKKTILMFGRHHGDEGTANWLIEGFFNEYLVNKKFRDEYQLVLYLMINPDGTEAKSRYNANGRDLNRSWSANPKNDHDEIKVIHGDLRKVMQKIGQHIFIALDMHGSWSKDFIYRVERDYVSIDFYNKQQNFIDELGIFDPWQEGNFILSNGDKRMARLVLINHYKKNALTHETIKNIPRKNNEGRTKQSLIDQGIAIVQTIKNIY
jgi:hypothetical protein